MTDKISFPPMLDLPPGALEAHKRHLLSEIARESETRRVGLWALRRPKVAAVALACSAVIAGAMIGVFSIRTGTPAKTTVGNTNALGRSSSGNLAGSLPTVARPLPAFAKQATLAEAQTALGQPVVLPQTAAIGPSDAGPVWVASLTDQDSGGTVTTVAVTFPTQGMVMEYTRPAPSDGSAAHFQGMAQGMVSPSGTPIAQVISLSGGVPALAVQQNSDETGSNFGEIIFNVGGTEVRVMGHNDQATLQGAAESVLARASA